MAYIGIQPAEKFTSFATQEFSTSATTSYTLDHAVANENEIALFVNNVRQQPGSGKAYTASGTALTLSAATASTDTMYCVFLGRALQTVTPATNSVTPAMTNFFNASTSSADLGTGLHVKSGDSSVSSLSASHDELVVESDGNVGISIIGGTSSTMGVAFGDSGDSDIGRINYVHSDNSMRFINNASENARIDSSGNFKFNSGFGSLTTVYGVKVWVNFNGSGTLAIRDSGGVSSVTDNGTGSYVVNFSNNMPDTNYVTLVNPGPVISTGAKQFYFTSSSQPDAVGSTNIASRSVDVDDNGFAVADNDYVSFIAIR